MISVLRAGLLFSIVFGSLGTAENNRSLGYLHEQHPIMGYEKLDFYYKCTDGIETTVSQVSCLRKELQLWEEVLADINLFVSKTGFGNDAALSKNNYTTAQKSWKKFVAADCRMQTDLFKGGSYASVLWYQCRAEKAKIRVLQLIEYKVMSLIPEVGSEVLSRASKGIRLGCAGFSFTRYTKSHHLALRSLHIGHYV